MTDFLAAEDRALLERHGLATFDALWAKQLDAVDEPNTSRGGWSSVFRLELDGHGYYLKRQSNYLTRSLHRPFGEPSFSREFRNISRYRKLGIPALQAAFYGERKVAAVITRGVLIYPREIDKALGIAPFVDAAPVLKALAPVSTNIAAGGNESALPQGMGRAKQRE